MTGADVDVPPSRERRPEGAAEIRARGSPTGIVVANAPVSYGAFELTVGIDPNVPDGRQVLDEVAAAGYAGIDLGPLGYLGRGEELGRRLAERGLALAGAYLELPYADPGVLLGVLPQLDAMLDTFEATDTVTSGPRPRPTLADAGSDARRARPGRAAGEPSLGLDDDGWRRFGEGLALVVGRCRARGYEPTFHHETGTYVEAPWEIERVLELSDIGLCLDTGHLLLGGGDPLTAVSAWGSRINQVHLKDARRSVMAAIVAEGGGTSEIWSREAFVPLGQGDLDVDGVLDALRRLGYAGWLVVEQDSFPQTAARFEQAAADQRANREFLARRGL
jgi:inosose dehydratase